jgi:hypothetical protein
MSSKWNRYLEEKPPQQFAVKQSEYRTAGKHSSAFSPSSIAANRGYSTVSFSSTASLTAIFLFCKWQQDDHVFWIL